MLRKLLTTSVIILLLSHCLASQASFDKAMEIYASGKYQEAKGAFEALAAIGDRPSLFNLGVMYYRGEVGDPDPVKAYVLMQIANEGLEDQEYSKVAGFIYSRLDDVQKERAESVYGELNKIHNIATIKDNIFPKPLNDEECPPEINPIKREAPTYPKSEARLGRMGIVNLEFTISPEGYPRDITISRSTNDMFTDTSVKAAKKFLYAPPVGGTPIYGHRNVFIYKLSEFAGEEVKIRTRRLTRELDELKESASSGDVVAQYVYAARLNTFRYFKSYLENVDLQYKAANEWFMKSAENGLPNAQYEIGRNMIEGRGCEVDVANGNKWINAAAVGGYSPAQKALALSALSVSDVPREKSIAALGWLRNAAQSEDYSAKLLLAWELSTSDIQGLRNGNEALKILDEKPKNYFDRVRILETVAAAHAEAGSFGKAVKAQKKAKKAAEKLGWDIPLVSERLGLYQHKQAYRGSYY